MPESRLHSARESGLTCALCGKTCRSVYAAPGDTKARMCAECFFKPPPVAERTQTDV